MGDQAISCVLYVFPFYCFTFVCFALQVPSTRDTPRCLLRVAAHCRQPHTKKKKHSFRRELKKKKMMLKKELKLPQHNEETGKQNLC